MISDRPEHQIAEFDLADALVASERQRWLNEGMTLCWTDQDFHDKAVLTRQIISMGARATMTHQHLAAMIVKALEEHIPTRKEDT